MVHVTDPVQPGACDTNVIKLVNAKEWPGIDVYCRSEGSYIGDTSVDELGVVVKHLRQVISSNTCYTY